MNTSDYRPCRQCGEYFHADQPWKHICISCFKDNKRKEREREAGANQQQYRQHNHQKHNHQKPAQGIPPDMLRLMIILCHPDKHGGKDAATKVTQWLLSQRAINDGSI